MSYKNIKYFKSLEEQLEEALKPMIAFGQSKAQAKKEGTAHERIFSFQTYTTYKQQLLLYIKWLKEKHPETTSLNKCKKYITEYLDGRVAQGLSAWTISTDCMAINKLFQLKPGDKGYYEPPKRKRNNIIRSRERVKADYHFSEKKNAELVNFAKATGLRRSGLSSIKGDCLYTKEEIKEMVNIINPNMLTTDSDRKQYKALQDTFLFDEQYFIKVIEKGGKLRYLPVVGVNTQEVVNRIRSTDKNKKVWEYVHSNADIHGYRSEYATKIYKKYARNIEDIPVDEKVRINGKKYKNAIYCCRKEEKGKKLDRIAMYKVSKALGHNRIDVVAENYLRGI